MPEAYAPDTAATTPTPTPGTRSLVDALIAARRSSQDVVLEGVHAVKHATRFGAELTAILTVDIDATTRLLTELAPDVSDTVLARTSRVSQEEWRRLAPRGLPSPVIAVARRPSIAAADVLAARGPVLLLEEPRHLGNLGAAIRVAAAADAGGVLVVGSADPYHPTAVRSAAGLQFALPVASAPELPATSRRLVALDADGVPLTKGHLGDGVILAVGTERGGLSDSLLRRAEIRVGIPMREGVSSLNLATAVAVALYSA